MDFSPAINGAGSGFAVAGAGLQLRRFEAEPPPAVRPVRHVDFVIPPARLCRSCERRRKNRGLSGRGRRRRISSQKRIHAMQTCRVISERHTFSGRPEKPGGASGFVSLFGLVMKRRRPTIQCGRAMAGLVCLLAFLCGASGALPELCALAASLDRSHTPLVGARDNGLVLVLSHVKRGASAATTPRHRHGVVARGLCLLANQNSTQADHRLEFASVGVSESARPGLKLAARAAPGVAVFNCFARAPLPMGKLVAPVRTFAPSCPSHPLLSTRFTVLLV